MVGQECRSNVVGVYKIGGMCTEWSGIDDVRGQCGDIYVAENQHVQRFGKGRHITKHVANSLCAVSDTNGIVFIEASVSDACSFRPTKERVVAVASR